MALYGNNKKSGRGRRPKQFKSQPHKATFIAPTEQPKQIDYDKLNKNLSVGVALHSTVNSRTATNVLTAVNDYSNPDLQNRETIVKLSRQLRSVEGVCSTVADLLTDFCVTKGYFESDNDELKFVLNKWADAVNSSAELAKAKGIVFPVAGLRSLARKIFDDYITDGDAIFTVFWKNGVKLDPQSTDSYFLPMAIKSIDSLSLSADADLAQLGVERLELVLADNLIKRIKTPVTEADKFLKDNLPKEWVKFITAGDPIVLDANVTYHIKRNGKDWKPWGEPLFLKAFTAVAAKRRLQAVDDATIDGLINRFTIFKLGLEDRDKNPAYHIPSNARVQALVDILSNSKRANAAVWPGPDLDVIDIGPDGKVLEFHQKYKQADMDILRALHVAPLLIDGASAGQSTSDWAAFLSTEVGLDAVRNELEKTFTSIAKEIALANNMQYEHLYYKFDTQLLKDEQKIRNFALKVFELGGISIETFVKQMGYDFNTEKRNKEAEEADGTSQLFVNPNIPGFTGVGGPGQSAPVNPDGGEGRPANEPAPAKAASNPLDNVTSFYSLYTKTFETIQQNVQRRLMIDSEDISFADMAIISGFSQFKQLVEAQLRGTYMAATGGNITKELDILLSWSSSFINAFYRDLRKALADNPAGFDKVLESSRRRVFLYAQESYKKAVWLGRFAKARLSGIKEGTWKCSDKDSKCAEHNHKVYSLDFLISNFPGHPNCLCTIDLEKK